MKKVFIGLAVMCVGLFADNSQRIDNEKLKQTLEKEATVYGCDKLERDKDESDVNFSERIRKCMIISFLNSTREILEENKK